MKIHLLYLIAGMVCSQAPIQQPLQTETYVAYADSCFRSRYGVIPTSYLVVSVQQQMLIHVDSGKVIHSYPVSTSKSGTGSRQNSNQTPLGFHRVTEKIGDGVPINGILKSRQYTGRQAEIIHEKRSVNSDDVTTRILWLSGEDAGKNKGGNVDSHARFIYIHGTPEEGLIGTPASHGCIRMLNKDVLELFGRVSVNTKVLISAR